MGSILIKTATGGYGQHFNKTANREGESDSNSYMDKTCTKPHSITIPNINVRTKNHTIILYTEASECHI